MAPEGRGIGLINKLRCLSAPGPLPRRRDEATSTLALEPEETPPSRNPAKVEAFGRGHQHHRGQKPPSAPCSGDDLRCSPEKIPCSDPQGIETKTRRIPGVWPSQIRVFDAGVRTIPCIFPGKQGNAQERGSLMTACTASLASRDILFGALRTAGMAQNAGLSTHLSNHEDGLRSPFWAVFGLSPAPFSDTTEPRRFWYGYQNFGRSMSYGAADAARVWKAPARAGYTRIERFEFWLTLDQPRGKVLTR
jgi:hypothetical protein